MVVEESGDRARQGWFHLGDPTQVRAARGPAVAAGPGRGLSFNLWTFFAHRPPCGVPESRGSAFFTSALIPHPPVRTPFLRTAGAAVPAGSLAPVLSRNMARIFDFLRRPHPQKARRGDIRSHA